MNYIMTTFNTTAGKQYILIDAEGKLTEPRFLPFTPGFDTKEDATSISRAASKTRSRIKQRLTKQFGACEVLGSTIVDDQEIRSSCLEYSYVDASRRFGTKEQVEEMLASISELEFDDIAEEPSEEAVALEKMFLDDMAKMVNTMKNREADTKTVRNIGYLLQVTLYHKGLSTSFYAGRYNGIAYNPNTLRSHTYGYADYTYFTGKNMTIIRSWAEIFRKYGEQLNRRIKLEVVEATYNEDDCQIKVVGGCDKWFR